MLTGKGLFIWQISKCEKGVPSAIAARAQAAGLSHVLIKIAQEGIAYSPNESLLPPLISALRARGIGVWGWHYVKGDNPTAEAIIATTQVKKYSLDGYVIDAEGEYETVAKTDQAKAFMTKLREGLTSTPIALCSYRYPTLHRGLPWAAFLEKCDFNMPQVYWEQSHNPAVQLRRCMAEFGNAALVGFVRPMMPVGAAYATFNQDGTLLWRPSAGDVVEFLNTAKTQGLPAASMYSWDAATAPGNTQLFDAVSAFSWPASTPPPPDPDPIPPVTTKTLGFFTFSLADEEDLQPLIKIIEFHNRTGRWPDIPAE